MDKLVISSVHVLPGNFYVTKLFEITYKPPEMVLDYILNTNDFVTIVKL